jgi:Domain of unknown function (DUF1772)
MSEVFQPGGDMTELLSLAAVLACTLFSGAAIYINLVEHPARLSCGTELAVAEWKPSYERATRMQASLAIVAAIGGAVLWLRGSGPLWLWGALLIFTVVPFTLVVIRPTNIRLGQLDRDRGSAETRRLLEKWGRLHAVRSGLSLAASVFYVRALSEL